MPEQSLSPPPVINSAPVPSGFAPPAAKAEAGGALGYTAPRFPAQGAALDQVGGPKAS